MLDFTQEVEQALAAPVPANEIKSKGGKGRYTDVAWVYSRLNQAVGVTGWQVNYTCNGHSPLKVAAGGTDREGKPVMKTILGQMVCTLEVLGVVKSAVVDIEFEDRMYGTPATNAQARVFKRAAMQFGVAQELWNDEVPYTEAPAKKGTSTATQRGNVVTLSEKRIEILKDKGFTDADLGKVTRYDVVGTAIELSKALKMARGQKFDRDVIKLLLANKSLEDIQASLEDDGEEEATEEEDNDYEE